MHVFSLLQEQEWNPKRHVEKILGRIGACDVTVACWEPGQISPYHCHPHATEIYFCFEGGGRMRTPAATVDVVPGAFVVHPGGEVHEFANWPQRTLLFRVRYGADRANSILNNHGCKMVLPGVSDPETNEVIAKLIGRAEYTDVQLSHNDGKASRSYSLRREQMASPDALRQLPEGTGVVLYRGKPPTIVRLRPWYAERTLTDLVRGDASHAN